MDGLGIPTGTTVDPPPVEGPPLPAGTKNVIPPVDSLALPVGTKVVSLPVDSPALPTGTKIVNSLLLAKLSPLEQKSWFRPLPGAPPPTPLEQQSVALVTTPTILKQLYYELRAVQSN